MKKKLLTFSILPFVSLAPVALAVSCSQQSRIKQKEQKYIDLSVNKGIEEGLKLAGVDKNSPEAKETIKQIKSTSEGLAKLALDAIKQSAKSDDEYEKALDKAIKEIEKLHLT